SHNPLEKNELPCRHAAGAAPDAREVQATGAGGFVALSRFVVANGMVAEVKQAFIDRPRLVDDVPGFLKLDVISPLDAPDEIWLITYWADEASYRTWHGGHTYKGSHAGIPKGLRLDPRGTEIRTFEFICS
ncbi:MAG: antibiotic biosynthesis monooxygenase family protein, partial [Bacteroidota bacterium]